MTSMLPFCSKFFHPIHLCVPCLPKTCLSSVSQIFLTHFKTLLMPLLNDFPAALMLIQILSFPSHFLLLLPMLLLPLLLFFFFAS